MSSTFESFLVTLTETARNEYSKRKSSQQGQLQGQNTFKSFQKKDLFGFRTVYQILV